MTTDNKESRICDIDCPYNDHNVCWAWDWFWHNCGDRFPEKAKTNRTKTILTRITVGIILLGLLTWYLTQPVYFYVQNIQASFLSVRPVKKKGNKFVPTSRVLIIKRCGSPEIGKVIKTQRWQRTFVYDFWVMFQKVENRSKVMEMENENTSTN